MARLYHIIDHSDEREFIHLARTDISSAILI
jgi:hypothetical protein